MNDILMHHGILGMKWGVRRYQRKDGSLTNAGKRRLEGQKEDSMSYRYNKSGEKGSVGLKRKIKSNIDDKRNRSLTDAGKRRYSDQQRIRDQKIYGKKAAQRIERRVASGEGVQSARHDEAVKRSTKPGKKRIGIGIAKGAAGLAVTGASVLAITGKGSVGRTLKRLSNTGMNAVGELVGVDASKYTNAALAGIAGLGVKDLVSGGKDIVYGTRDIERNRSKF